MVALETKESASGGTARGLSEKDFAELMEVFNRNASQLEATHRQLKDKVASLEAELHRKNEELRRKERLASLGEMAAGIAHEIRNPLGGVGLYASLLERELSTEESKRDLVRKILGGVKQMDNIIEGVLAFAAQPRPTKAPASLRDMLESAVAYVAHVVEARGIRIESAYDSALKTVIMDAHQMDRVFSNILLNAVEAAREGGAVRIRTWDKEGAVCVSIRDDGTGIPEDILPRIFNPFFTTKPKGTGLGLAIVYRMVEGHGGAVSAKNAPEGGAEFTVELPLE